MTRTHAVFVEPEFSFGFDPRPVAPLTPAERRELVEMVRAVLRPLWPAGDLVDFRWLAAEADAGVERLEAERQRRGLSFASVRAGAARWLDAHRPGWR